MILRCLLDCSHIGKEERHGPNLIATCPLSPIFGFDRDKSDQVLESGNNEMESSEVTELLSLHGGIPVTGSSGIKQTETVQHVLIYGSVCAKRG